MTKTICTVCGAELDAEGKFCPDCGSRIPEPAAPQPQATPPQVVAPVPMAVAPVMAKPVGPNTQLSVMGYVLTMLAISVPIIGVILTFVWAFGSKTNRARKNYCRAVLVLAGLSLLLVIVFFALNYSTFMQFSSVLTE